MLAAYSGHSGGAGSDYLPYRTDDQIKAGRLTDELGHDFQLNDAYMRAVELLARIEGDET